MLGEHVTINQTLVVTVFSMAIVFISLLAISFILDIFRMTLSGEGKKNKEEIKPAPIMNEKPQETKENEEELVAVITAALVASLGKSVDGLLVKNIRRIPDSEPAWTKAGRLELMR